MVFCKYLFNLRLKDTKGVLEKTKIKRNLRLARIKVKLVINLDSATWNKELKRNLTVGKLYEDTLCFHIMACGSVI